MEFFLIKDSLTPATMAEAGAHEHPYVALATHGEFAENRVFFDMGIDMDIPLMASTTSAEVNVDAVIGTFHIPDRKAITENAHTFAYAFDEKGIVFLDDDGFAREKLENIARTKNRRLPSLERFLFDFLEQITDDDLRLLEKYEDRLDDLEELAQGDEGEAVPDALAAIRSEVSRLKLHYGQLLDLSQELEEDENEFFDENNLRYFSMYSNRIKTLTDICSAIQ